MILGGEIIDPELKLTDKVSKKKYFLRRKSFNYNLSKITNRKYASWDIPKFMLRILVF